MAYPAGCTFNSDTLITTCVKGCPTFRYFPKYRPRPHRVDGPMDDRLTGDYYYRRLAARSFAPYPSRISWPSVQLADSRVTLRGGGKFGILEKLRTLILNFKTHLAQFQYKHIYPGCKQEGSQAVTDHHEN